MKKGFTLVELLAVILLLGIIALVIFPQIVGLLNNSKQKAYNEQINTLIQATKNWAIRHNSELPNEEGPTLCVSLDDLHNEGYIADKDITDPRATSSKILGSILITYNSEFQQYVYTYNENVCP